MNMFDRTLLLLGEEAMEKLNRSRVAIFGVGGVGGYVFEALVRSGVGTIDIIDNDKVSLTNINRQIIATTRSLGQFKCDVAYERAKDINPDVVINKHICFFLPENKHEFDFSKYDYVVDAVDTVAAKISIIETCNEENVPVISSMGAGNKLNPEMFEIADIYKTTMDPLAKVMRRELKKRGIKKLKCVYSKEIPIKPQINIDTDEGAINKKRVTPGSIAFVPSCAGLIIAGEVIKDLTGVRN